VVQRVVYLLVIFCFGAAVGSFLNVVMYRLPRGKSLIWPPSHCPRCQHQLSMVRENIPILGWFLVRGKCRYCSEPVSFWYAVVEFATACFVVASYLYLVGYQGRSLGHFAVWTGLALAIVAAGVIDLQTYLIPDAITKLGMVLAPVVSFLVPSIHPALGWPANERLQGVASSLVGLAAGAGFVYAVGVLGKLIFGREAMGFGDVKFVGMIGGFLGWQAIVWTFIIGSILGLVFVLVGLIRTEKGALPFAPSLGLGAIAFMVWQRPLVHQLTQFGASLRWVFWPD
jgi:leader peptidase (prepilin peptidase)/N-methyltransferase